MAHDIKPAQIPREGYEFQDLVGARLLIDFFRNPDRYDWISIERLEQAFDGLDDVVCKLKGEVLFDLHQVKFTVEPGRPDLALSWDWLLKARGAGRSLLAKWMETVSRHQQAGTFHSARLVTNRIPDEAFGACLEAQRIRFDRLSAAARERVVETAGGEDAARAFFEVFEFHTEPVGIDAFETNQMARVCPSDTDVAGWYFFRSCISTWARRKNRPRPGGEIHHSDLVTALSKSRVRAISQDLSVPASYVPPSAVLDQAIRARLAAGPSVTVLWGAPGRGKSTYLSKLKQDLEAEGACVLRHHYFLSPHDTTDDRTSYPVIAHSLIDQLRKCLPELGISADGNTETLGDLLEKAGGHLRQEGKQLILIIDGLDHVFREYRSRDHLDHLFSRLLPLPENVGLLVGTQKVADDQLPGKLLAASPKADWLELPRLDGTATRAWVGKREAAAPLPRPEAWEADAWLEEVSSALYEVSGGHPLHLAYSFERASRSPELFGPELIRSLPACPDGDIMAYYDRLWATLPPRAKALLRTLAHAGFNFPNFSALCSAAGTSLSEEAIDDVEFLLSIESGEVVPFHSSLSAFVGQTDRFEACRAETLERISAWLKAAAPTYYRWAWLWIIEARLGDEAGLISGPSQDWIVESLGQGAPASQVARILRQGARCALTGRNYARALQLRHMEVRVLNGFSFQMTETEYLFETVLSLCPDASFRRALIGDLTRKSNEELVVLSRYARSSDLAALKQGIREEFVKRQKSVAGSRKGYRGDFERTVAAAVSSLAAGGRLDHDRLLTIAGKLDEAEIVLNAAISGARAMRDGEFLKKITNEENLSGCYDQDMADCSLVWIWMEEGLPAADLPRGLGAVSPMLAAFEAWTSGAVSAKGLALSDLSGLNGRYLEYSGPPQLTSAFVDAFFLGFLTGLGSDLPSELDTASLGDAKWTWSLERFADLEGIGEAFGAPGATSLAGLHESLEAIAPEWAAQSDEVRSQYQAFLRAVDVIGLALTAFEKARSGHAGFLEGDFRRLGRSQHWNPERWLQRYLAFGEAFLPSAVAAEFISERADHLDRHVTQMDERGALWSQLAALARRHGMTGQAAALSARACRCAVGYGYRKDYFMWSVIDAVRICREELNIDITARLDRIEPAVLAICDYTDGDETNHVPSHYNALIADHAPTRVAGLYNTYLEAESWEDAQDLLEKQVGKADLSSPFAMALGVTAIDQGGPFAVARRAGEEGGPAAGLSLAIEALTGSPAQPFGRPYADTQLIEKDEVDVSAYPPSDVFRFVEMLADLGWKADAQRDFGRWIVFWASEGRELEVVKAIHDVEGAARHAWVLERCSDAVFAVVRAVEGRTKSFPWLVRAHTESYGWSHIGSRASDARRRFERVATDFRDRVDEFILETAMQRNPRFGPEESGPVLGYDRLVLLLALCGRSHEALACADAMIDIVRDETSDLPLRAA